MSLKYNTIEVNGFRVPATFHDALTKIKDGFEKGKVNFAASGSYVFHDPVLGRNVFCPIGYLLHRKQRDEVLMYDHDGGCYDIGNKDMWKHFGEKNLLAMLSMDRKLADHLQTRFDEIATDSNQTKITADQRRAFLTVIRKMFEIPNFDNPALA